MKKLGIVICAVLLSSAAFSQVETKKEVETAKKEEVKVEKEVKVTEENGVKTVEITTVRGGLVEREVFTGEAAEIKLAELEKEAVKAEGSNERQIVRKKMVKEVEVKEVEPAKPLEEQRRD